MDVTSELPHTISYIVTYISKLNSFNELSEDKKPPRGIWDKPYKLKLFFDEVFEIKRNRETTSIEFDPEEVE